MSTAPEIWTWDEESFIRAWEAGVFANRRVELVQGEVWPVVIGPWHGLVAANLARLLWVEGWQTTSAALPSGGSLPDPDVWVLRRGSPPVAVLGTTKRLNRPNPADVALVVEVADSSFAADVHIKSRIYAAGYYPQYWVVHRGGIEVFTDPGEAGYRTRTSVPAGGRITLPYAAVELSVADILDARD
ncbi:MAG: Uma2 family endonuclease [Sporichthyaceae bacterium]